jgi:hypothetical protein
MLRRHSEISRTLLFFAEALLVIASWLGAFAIRFHTGIPAPRGLPQVEPYMLSLGVLVPLWGW